MKKAILEKLTILFTTAFGLVAALAWNDTIKILFKKILGTPDSLGAMLTYAIIVTVIAVVVTIQVGKISDRLE